MHKPRYLPLLAYTTICYEDKHQLSFYTTSIKMPNFTLNVIEVTLP